MNTKISKQEKRAIRREWINSFLQKGWMISGKSDGLSILKQQIRLEERLHYGKELRAYK